MKISEAFAIAMANQEAGRTDLAEDICRRIVAVEPGHAEAHHLLGSIAYQQGRQEQAVERFEAAVRCDGGRADFHNNLGVAYKAMGNSAAAAECYQRALSLRPDYADAYGNLGLAWQEQGRLPEAVGCFRQAVLLNPQFADAYKNLAAACHELGQSDEAVEHCQQALQLQPDDPLTLYNLGTILLDQGRVAEAIVCYGRCLELQPGWAAAHYNLGNALVASDRLEEASESYQRALASRPDLADGLNNLGNTWLAQGRLEEAVGCFRRALELQPALVQAHDNLLYSLHYQPGATLAELAAAHREFGQRLAEPLRAQWRAYDNRPDPERRLRIGFVSPDFGRHPVGYLLIRAVENLDRGQCEVVCYSNRLVADELTARFQAAAVLWRNVFRTPDDRLAEQVREDRVDILFDLAGHTAHNRLGLFARKPAPIQITWIGYPGTTGLAAIDYLLADRYQVPPESEPHYTERVLRMPDGYVCFDPPAEAPPVGPLSALAEGHVTFGSFNNPAKITPQVIAAWARILRRLPSAELILAYRGFNGPGVSARIRRLLAEQQVAADRVQLLGWSPRAAVLARYNQIDLALDVFPYSGGLTTCEALWMGVPVVTCPGETFASRHSLSHLWSAGLTETIAGDLDEYVELAVKLAQDLPRLAEIRAGLRDQVARSPLCDGPRFADNLLRLLRGVWREWTARSARVS